MEIKAVDVIEDVLKEALVLWYEKKFTTREYNCK
jgi:hypothetical protein